MSFFGGIKRIFGLSDDDADVLDYLDNNTDSDVAVAEVKINKDADNFDENGEIPDGIFDGLIDIINSNLSPLVLKCIDVEAEKKYLYEALGPRFAEFVKATREKSLNVARDEWDKEKAELNKKAEELKSRCVSAEAEMNDMKSIKMSEERQRLALKERIRKLEEQVEAVEAEKEQRVLENKSLLNKLKVSQVRGGDNEEAEKEIQALVEQVEGLKKQLAQATTGSEADEAQKAELEALNDRIVEKDKVIEDIQAKLEEAQNTITELQEEFAVAGVELVKTKTELDNANADLAKASENLSLLDEIQAQLVLVEEFKKNKEEEIQGLKLQISNLEAEKEEAVKNAVGNEANKFEELINESEKLCDNLKFQIAELEQELTACNERIGVLAQENVDTLDVLHKRDVQLNQYKQEAEESTKRIGELCDEIETLKQELSATKDTHSREINDLKSAEVVKIQKFQAEIAELQAKLNVTGEVDDLLIDEELRQAVDETFDDVEIKEDDLDAFSVIEEELLLSETIDKPMLESVEGKSVEENDDVDISWLLPDEGKIADSIVFEEDDVKVEEVESISETDNKSTKAKDSEEEETQTQMSLF